MSKSLSSFVAATLAVLVVILASATMAFAQVGPPPPETVNSEDIAINFSISWHWIRGLMCFAGGLVVGWTVCNMRRNNVVVAAGRTVPMLAILLLSANSAFAQEAPLPTAQPAATPAAVVSAPASSQEAPVPNLAPKPTVNELNDLDKKWQEFVAIKDAEIAQLKQSRNGSFWGVLFIGLLIGVGIGYLLGKRNRGTEARGPFGGGAAAHLLVLALLMPGLAYAQAAPPNAPITSVSPAIVKSAATTKVTVITSTACTNPQVTFGAGITAKNVTATTNGFTMDLEVTPVKTEGVTRWPVNCGGNSMAAPPDASVYVLGNRLDEHVDAKLKAAISAALKNVTAKDPTARNQIVGLTTKVNGMEARVTQQAGLAAMNAQAEVVKATAGMQEQLNDLTRAYNTLSRENADLRARTAELEKHNAVQDDGIELANRLLLNATDKGMFKRGKFIKNPEERAAIEAVRSE